MDELNQATLIRSIVGNWGPDSANLECPICKSNEVSIFDVVDDKDDDWYLVTIKLLCNENHPWSINFQKLIDEVLEMWIEMPVIDYKAYLTSDEWKEKAHNAKECAGWRCQLCNRFGYKGKGLHAHHRTYERLTNEEPGDITVLCASCHAKYHGK